MTLLYIYLGSVALSIGSVHLVNLYINKEIENRGYEFKQKKKNIYKSIIDYIKSYALLAVPIVGVSFGIYMFLTAEKICEEYINKSIVDGSIIKKEEKEEPRLIESIEIDNNLVRGARVVVYKVDNNQRQEITRREKIAFLKEEYSRLTGEKLQSDNVEQKKYGLRR